MGITVGGETQRRGAGLEGARKCCVGRLGGGEGVVRMGRGE